ncbi:MAG: SDR family oxidoreductase [Pseudonocardiaceae bacterium]
MLPRAVDQLVALAQERYDRLDVLVNNAGVGLNSPLDDLRVDDWDAMIDINVKGVLYGIAAALPVFRALRRRRCRPEGASAAPRTPGADRHPP